MEYLKELHIPFRTKVKIGGREVDFLIGRYAIEIDCHDQSVKKNWAIIKEGYFPVHFSNEAVRNKESIKNYLIQIHGRFIIRNKPIH